MNSVKWISPSNPPLFNSLHQKPSDRKVRQKIILATSYQCIFQMYQYIFAKNKQLASRMLWSRSLFPVSNPSIGMSYRTVSVFWPIIYPITDNCNHSLRPNLFCLGCVIFWKLSFRHFLACLPSPDFHRAFARRFAGSKSACLHLPNLIGVLRANSPMKITDRTRHARRAL